MWLWLTLALPISLTIGNPVITNDLVTVEASISGAASNYYLQGLLRSTSSSKYFGETLGSQGTYLDYISNPEKELIASSFFVTNIVEASWSGKLAMRYKADDPLYTGPGSYELKLRRFTGGSSTAAAESNTLTVNLTQQQPTATPTSTPTPSPSPSPPPSTINNLPSTTPSHSPSPTPSSSTNHDLPPTNYDLTSATVAGIATSLPEASPSPSIIPSPLSTTYDLQPTINQSRLKVVIGIGSGLLSLATAIYFGIRKFKDSHV